VLQLPVVSEDGAAPRPGLRAVPALSDDTAPGEDPEQPASDADAVL
jgi:hypothetical protein